MTFLEINLIRDIQALESKNHEILLREIKDNLKKYIAIPHS